MSFSICATFFIRIVNSVIYKIVTGRVKLCNLTQMETVKQSRYFLIFFLHSNTPPVKISMLIISTSWFNNESMTHVTESSSRNLGLFNVSITSSLNPFQATGLFLYHLKTSQKLRLTDVFRGYRKSAWNGFINAVAHERERKDLLPFLTYVWLLHDQLWAIIEGTALLTRC